MVLRVIKSSDHTFHRRSVCVRSPWVTGAVGGKRVPIFVLFASTVSQFVLSCAVLWDLNRVYCAVGSVQPGCDPDPSVVDIRTFLKRIVI